MNTRTNLPADGETTGEDEHQDEALRAGQGEGEGADEGDTEEEIARARRLGWIPESEWKGKKPPKHGFMDAREYIQRGEQLLPIAISRAQTLETKLGDRDRENGDLKTQLQEANRRIEEVGGVVRTLHKQSVDAAKRAYEKARRDLLDEQVAAAGEANPERVRHIQTQIDELDKTKPTDVEEADETTRREAERRGTPANPEEGQGDNRPKVSEVTKKWVEANPWFNASPLLNGAAIEQHDKNLKSGMTEAESFDELTEQIKEQFPDRFENGERRRPAPVARPGGTPPKKKVKTFEDLPAESKQAYAEISRHDPKYTKEQYVKDYQWD